MTVSNGGERDNTYRIAVDAMGGDFAPAELVEGALLGAKQSGVQILLVGDEPAVEAELERLGAVLNKHDKEPLGRRRHYEC